MRYVVFGFDNYYPEGGVDDIVLTTDDIEKVKEYIRWFRTESETDDMDKKYMYDSDNFQVYDTVYNDTIYNAYRSLNYYRSSGGGKKLTKDVIEEVNLIGV